MNSDNESQSESDHSHASDINYIPSEDELKSLNGSPEKFDGRKTGKRSANERSNQTQQSKKKKTKADKPPIKNKNYNEFFKNLGFASKSPEKLVETAENTEIITVPEDSIESSQTSQHTLEKNDSNAEHSNKSMQDDIRELTNVVYGLQRQLARVETLIKFQKENEADSGDINSRKESYIEILQSHGLPIASKEKLDEIEQNLKAVDFKTKLVCHVLQ